jgi:hypothetical protein
MGDKVHSLTANSRNTVRRFASRQRAALLFAVIQGTCALSPELQNILIQIPIAGIVLFQTFRFLDHIKTHNDRMFEFLARQSEINREFLAAQRVANNEATGRLAEEIKTLRLELAKEYEK